MEINEYLVKFIQIVKEMESLDFFMVGAKLSKTEFRLLREIIMEGEKIKKSYLPNLRADWALPVPPFRKSFRRWKSGAFCSG